MKFSILAVAAVAAASISSAAAFDHDKSDSSLEGATPATPNLRRFAREDRHLATVEERKLETTSVVLPEGYVTRMREDDGGIHCQMWAYQDYKRIYCKLVDQPFITSGKHQDGMVVIGSGCSVETNRIDHWGWGSDTNESDIAKGPSFIFVPVNQDLTTSQVQACFPQGSQFRIEVEVPDVALPDVALPKGDVGAYCASGDYCQSGYCTGMVCGECPTVGSSNGCGSSKFCYDSLAGYKCKDKLGFGKSCWVDNDCSSGYCTDTVCGDCPTVGSKTGCSSSQFCYDSWGGYKCKNCDGRDTYCSTVFDTCKTCCNGYYWWGASTYCK